MILWPNTYKTKVPLWDAQSRACFILQGCTCPQGIILVSFSAFPTQIRKVWQIVTDDSNSINLYYLFIIFPNMHPKFLKIFKVTTEESSVSVKWIYRRKQWGNMLKLRRGDRFRQTIFSPWLQSTKPVLWKTEMSKGLSPGNSICTWRTLLWQWLCFALSKLTLRWRLLSSITDNCWLDLTQFSQGTEANGLEILCV